MKSFILIGFFFVAAAGVRADDYLITEYPDVYRILDGYQQKLSAGERLRFPQNRPWRILNKRMLLSDGFTTAMKVTAAGRIWFFVLDEKGQPQHTAPSAIRIIKKARSHSDTLIVAAKRAALFSDETAYPGIEHRQYLKPGEKLIRIFTYRGRDFVKPLSGNRFGWLTVKRKSGIKSAGKYSAPAAHHVFSVTVLKNLQQKIDATNKMYRQIFTLLNKHFGRQRATPQWMIVPRLNGWALYRQPDPGDFLKSRHYFEEKLRGVLWHSGYSLSASKDTLRVRLEKADEK